MSFIKVTIKETEGSELETFWNTDHIGEMRPHKALARVDQMRAERIWPKTTVFFNTNGQSVQVKETVKELLDQIRIS
jgi:hypothetical protein